MSVEKDLFKKFEETGKLDFGTRFFKADLHFHSPGSEDARGRNKYNFNPYKRKYPKTKDPEKYREKVKAIHEKILTNARKRAESIVERFREMNLSLVALTDHNGLATIWADDESERKVMDLAAPTWYELIDDEAQRINAMAGETVLTILPGVEISTVGVHILAIFPPTRPRRQIHFRICDLLHEAGLDIEIWGRNPFVGTTSVVDTIELIRKKGGVPIIAHIDGSDKAVLKLYPINSGAMKNIILNPSLPAVEIVKPGKFSKRDRKLKTTVKKWMDGQRVKKGLAPLGFFQGSDAHSLPDIAKRHTHVKMSDPTFSGFCAALDAPSSRVRISAFQKPSPEGLIIHSLVVKNRFFSTQRVRFNRHLNCVTGKISSGKTFLFNLMRAAVQPDAPLTEGEITLFIEKREGAESRFFAFTRTKKKNYMAVHELDIEASTARELTEKEALELEIIPRFFNSEKMNGYIDSREKLNEFLKKRLGDPGEEVVAEFNDAFAIGGFLDEKKTPLLVLDADADGYSLSVNTQWSEGKKKMTDFFNLSNSTRRAALMCMIIIRSDFGPAVIDAPENHFDKEDIIHYLTPIIKKNKDTQQVILFTKNSILAVNTDPDNYIMLETRGPGFKRIISGFAIDDEAQKPRLLNILEGSLKAFRKRAARYD
ncbi:MAG: hypothetical protein GY859_09020 [Desulfobacterales bacterium]|nr:hypothetical protein [Desulfobacterales bacterium]